MTEAGHTPWKARDIIRHFDDGPSEILRMAIIDAAGGEIVADVRDEAARDLIIRAVNSHAAMFEALTVAREELVVAIAFLGRDAGTGRLETTIPQLIERMSKADQAVIAALSQATGKE